MNNPLGEIIDDGQTIEFTRLLLEELEYLRYFYEQADFGPTHYDVVCSINENYGKPLPEGYSDEQRTQSPSDKVAAGIYPFMVCPREDYHMDPLEGCSDCSGVGYHQGVPNPEWNVTQ